MAARLVFVQPRQFSHQSSSWVSPHSSLLASSVSDFNGASLNFSVKVCLFVSLTDCYYYFYRLMASLGFVSNFFIKCFAELFFCLLFFDAHCVVLFIDYCLLLCIEGNSVK